MTEGYQAIIDAGNALGEAKTAPGGVIPYAIIPDGASIDELERLLPAPVRARATVTAKSVETFCAYVNRYTAEDTAIFADQETFRLVGIIDYHPVAGAAWREHLVTYNAPRSLEWQTWRATSGKRMTQAEFAQFIEDNVVDIRAPVGADVLEISRNLQAKKSVEFASAIRLADGARQFGYSETVNGASRNGTLEVPEEFTLGIPVFFGGIAYEVRARLRYRIDGGKLAIWYELYRPEYIERDAFEAVCREVSEATGIKVWQGMP